MLGAQAGGASRSCSASRGTGRVPGRVGAPVRGRPLWGARAGRDGLPARLPTPELLVSKRRHCPGRDSARTRTWRVVRATLGCPGMWPLALCGRRTPAGSASAPRFLDGLRTGSWKLNPRRSRRRDHPVSASDLEPEPAILGFGWGFNRQRT